MEIVGIIPAGGSASRISPLPCSKELYPVGFRSINNELGFRPKVVSHYLLEKMRLANIKKAYIILRDGKWDIPSYYGDGKSIDMHLAYLMMDLPYGVPFTLDQAYPFVRNSLVTLGFPDMIFEPDDVFLQLLDKQAASGADIVLGLFPAEKPHKTDMVELDGKGKIVSIHIKKDMPQLRYAWEIAVWTPVFSSFMHEYLLPKKKEADLKHQKELHVGDIIQAALDNNMKVESVIFKDGACLDIGTPNDLLKAAKMNIGTVHSSKET